MYPRYLLLCTALAEIHHRFLELLSANTAVIVIVKHPEGRLHVVQLVAALRDDVLGHHHKVLHVHAALPITVSLFYRRFIT